MIPGLNRKAGVRTEYVRLAVLAHFGTLGLLAGFPALDQPAALAALALLISFLGVAVGGDTVRPSGATKAAIGLPGGVQPVEPQE